MKRTLGFVAARAVAVNAEAATAIVIARILIFIESPLSRLRMHWDHETSDGLESRLQPGRLKAKLQTNPRFMASPLSVLFRMRWDHEPASEIQSAAGAAHSKT